MHAQQNGLRLYASPTRDDFIRTTALMQQVCYPGWTEIDPLDGEASGDLLAEILWID